jgi:hypothetical protein
LASSSRSLRWQGRGRRPPELIDARDLLTRWRAALDV